LKGLITCRLVGAIESAGEPLFVTFLSLAFVTLHAIAATGYQAEPRGPGKRIKLFSGLFAPSDRT